MLSHHVDPGFYPGVEGNKRILDIIRIGPIILDPGAKSPWVFTLANGKPLKNPRDSFSKGRRLAGLDWVRGLHDLRHFRATQWLIHGVDIYTVKDYLGHKRIETTQRYLHLVPTHAEHVVRAAQNAEQEEIKELARDQSGRHMGDTTLKQVAVQAGVPVTY